MNKNTNSPDLVALVAKVAQTFTETLSDSMRQKMNGRLERGIELAKAGHVFQFTDPHQPDKKRLFKVRSANPKQLDTFYIINLEAKTCECFDFQKGNVCKHRIAAYLVEQAIQTQKDVQSKKPEPEPTQPKRETIIWAVLKVNGKSIGVEVLDMTDQQATVRALPIVKEGNKLFPQLPFVEGTSSIDIVPKDSLIHVKVYQ